MHKLIQIEEEIIFDEILKIAQLEVGMSTSLFSLSSFHLIQTDLVYPFYSREKSP